MLFKITLFTCINLAAAQVTVCTWPQYPSDRFVFPITRCNMGNFTGINAYQVGTKLPVTWASSTTYLNLYIYQEGGGKEALQPLALNTSLKTFDFNGFPPHRLAVSNTFYFVLYKVLTSTPFLTSDYFNITDGPPQSVSSILPTSKTLATTTLPSRSLVTPTAANEPTPAVSSGATAADNSGTGSDNTVYHNNNKSSSSREIGIGLGVGLLGFAAIIALAMYFFIYRPKQKAAKELARFQQQPQFYDGMSSRQSCVGFSDKQVSPSPWVHGNSYRSQNSSYVAWPSQELEGLQQKPVPLAELLVEMEQPRYYEVGVANPRPELASGSVK